MDNTLKVIDKELARERAGGSDQLAAELFSMLIKELPRQREEISDTYRASDFIALRNHTHKLNGSATYCGVPALKAAAEALEGSLKRGETDQVPGEVDALLHEIERVLALPV